MIAGMVFSLEQRCICDQKDDVMSTLRTGTCWKDMIARDIWLDWRVRLTSSSGANGGQKIRKAVKCFKARRRPPCAQVRHFLSVNNRTGARDANSIHNLPAVLHLAVHYGPEAPRLSYMRASIRDCPMPGDAISPHHHKVHQRWN